ncbi:hypothetical protein [Sphingomonas sp. Leaf38]|uniref:hypothetical protein n=1 Tax=Sphingomonas sp. Leaf38 TaxID=1736217 RepID=UPI0006F3B066|nr:hypothetical protein [Sphingomonas sp. Leaf38]KQN29575.1 hypothetical protein ASE88_11825 [Sphingomonas sp. Leaf38]
MISYTVPTFLSATGSVTLDNYPGFGIRLVDTQTTGTGTIVHHPVATIQSDESVVGIDVAPTTTPGDGIFTARYETDVLQGRIRIGQSARSSVTTYSYSNAITVPAAAATLTGGVTTGTGDDYVGYYTWLAPAGATAGASITLRHVFYGPKTQRTDLPTTGSAQFSQVSRETSYFDLYTATPDQGIASFGDQFALKVDWPTRTITGTLRQISHVPAVAGPHYYLRFSGSFSATTGLVTGQVYEVAADTTTPVASGYSGDFAANFYGPAAKGLGMVFRLGKSDGTVVIARGIGHQGT